MQLIIKQLLGFIREIIRVKPKYLPTSAALPLRPNLSNENTHFGTGAKAVPAAAYTYLN